MTCTPEADLVRCLSEARGVLPFIASQTTETWPTQLEFLLASYAPEIGDIVDKRAFAFDDERKVVRFNRQSIAGVREAADAYAGEVCSDWSERDRSRVCEAAVNLFIIHELTHIVQNFPHYELVPEVKDGLGVEALALLDVTADFHAAWVAANIEWRIAGCPSDINVADYFTNMLMLAYVIGARGFPPLGRSHKVQRFVGVLLGAILNQSEQVGLLDRAQLNPVWTARVPLLAFDFSRTGSLNAFMTQPQLGLLLRDSVPVSKADIAAIWNGVGVVPTKKLAEMLARCLAASGILRPAVASTESIREVELLGRSS